MRIASRFRNLANDVRSFATHAPPGFEPEPRVRCFRCASLRRAQRSGGSRHPFRGEGWRGLFICWFAYSTAALLCIASAAAEHAASQTVQEPIELHAIADTGICAHPEEIEHQHGSKTTLRLKGNEHFVLLRFDTALLPPDLHPQRARLHLRTSSASRPQWIGLSSVATPWVEGMGTGPDAPNGATFLHADRRSRTWSGAHSNFLDVTFGAGGSAWEAAFVRHELGGWISVPVPTWLVRAMREGSSDGLALSDEKGQTRANHDVAAREGVAAARLSVWEFESSPPLLPEAVRSAPPNSARAAAERGTFQLEAWEGASACRFALGAAQIDAFPTLRASAALEPNARAGPELLSTLDADGITRRLTLYAHRGGTAHFALRLPASVHPIDIDMEGELPCTVYQATAVNTDHGPRLDPLLDLGAMPMELPSSEAPRVLMIEWQIKAAGPLISRSFDVALHLRCAEAEARIPARIFQSSSKLPAELRFQLSLNTYGRPANDPEIERSFYRLAHAHRATLAVVPYSQRGIVIEGLAPACEIDAQIVHWDFSTFAERYGSYFDGSAFAGCPRDAVPIDHWITPFNEAWPASFEEHYSWRGEFARHASEAPPIESAFSSRYAEIWRAGLVAWYDELSRRGWLHTRFQVFLNNKVDFRLQGRGTSWWLLDEPAYRDDFLALRWFADLHRQALPQEARGHMPFRLDLSRPQFRRAYLDQHVDLVINNAARWWPQASLDPVREHGEVLWSYGETPGIEQPLEQCAAWVFEAFLTGADGLVPWQSVGTLEHWQTASPLALLLPPATKVARGPAPTLRLKAMRDALEDVECLLQRLDAYEPRQRAAIRELISARLLPSLGLREAGRFSPHDTARAALRDADLSALLALHKILVVDPDALFAAPQNDQGK